jgi:hypothetical protein
MKSEQFTGSADFSRSINLGHTSDFIVSIRFGHTQDGESSRIFLETNLFTNSVILTTTSNFKSSAELTSSNSLSHALLFDNSATFTFITSPTLSTGRVSVSSESPGGLITTTGPSSSFQFVYSSHFHQTGNQMKSHQFTESDQFSPSADLESSEKFVVSIRFVLTQNGSGSEILLKSNLFTDSILLTTTSNFKSSTKLTSSSGLALSFGFGSSQPFKLSNAFETSSHFRSCVTPADISVKLIDSHSNLSFPTQTNADRSTEIPTAFPPPSGSHQLTKSTHQQTLIASFVLIQSPLPTFDDDRTTVNGRGSGNVGGIVAGIVIGLFALIALILFFIFIVRKRRSSCQDEEVERLGTEFDFESEPGTEMSMSYEQERHYISQDQTDQWEELEGLWEAGIAGETIFAV